MFQMFTVGEIAIDSSRANAGNCNSTMLSIREFAVVCETSAVSHNLFLKCNEMIVLSRASSNLKKVAIMLI